MSTRRRDSWKYLPALIPEGLGFITYQSPDRQYFEQTVHCYGR